MSDRENILTYLATQLATVTGVKVYRSREAAVQRQEGVVIVLKPQEETVVKVANEITVRDMTVSIVLIIRGIVPDSDADPYLTQIQAAIQADTTLGGLAARSIEKSTRWEMEVADLTALVAELVYVIKYLTPTGSISVLA